VVRKQKQKNPHAVALSRLGGLVRSEAKKRASKQRRSQGGSGKSRKKTIAARRNARRPPPQESLSVLIEKICARFGNCAIGRGDGGIRYSAPTLR
jgi:hypothetical protein